MKSHHLIVLTVVTVLAMIAALWSSGVREPTTDPTSSGLLAPGLDEQLNAVTSVEIAGTGDNAVTLRRGDAAWHIVEKDEYPADTGKVRQFLLQLAEARLLEPKTADPEKYGALGLAEGDGEDAALSVRVAAPLNANAGLSLLLGKTARDGTATYVRRPDEAQTWLASGDLAMDDDPLDWLDRAILDIPAARIQQVTIQHSDGETVTLTKAERDASNFDVSNVPEGEELKYASVANPTGSVLANLKLEDVASAAAHDMSVGETAEVTFLGFDGVVVTAKAYDADGKRFVNFSAAFDEEQARRFVPASLIDEIAAGDESTPDADAADDAPDADEPAAAEADAGPAVEPDFSTAREEADALNARLSPWSYVLSDFKLEQMSRRITDLLMEEEAE